MSSPYVYFSPSLTCIDLIHNISPLPMLLLSKIHRVDFLDSTKTGGGFSILMHKKHAQRMFSIFL